MPSASWKERQSPCELPTLCRDAFTRVPHRVAEEMAESESREDSGIAKEAPTVANGSATELLSAGAESDS